MDVDDHDFPLVRKNLNIISVLILILAYTNAKLNSLNFLGVQIELDAPKLYGALFVLYLYFIWRYLTKAPLKGGFWNDFVQYYMDSEEGVKKEHTFLKYKNVLMEKSPKLKSAFEKEPSTHFTGLRVVRFPSNPLTQLRLAFMFQTSEEWGDNKTYNIFVDHDLNVSRVYLYRKLLIFNVKYDKFGDYLFPLIPVIANLCFFLFAHQWQGSFYNLFIK